MICIYSYDDFFLAHAFQIYPYIVLNEPRANVCRKEERVLQALQTTELLFEERKGVYMCVKGRIVTLKP